MIYDFVVIGAGISGASAAYELAAQSKVLLIEAQSQAGYHSTGRSAAMFTPNFGNDLVRKINSLSAPFFLNPPAELADGSLLSTRGAVSVAAPGHEAELNDEIALSTDCNPIVELSTNDALAMIPFLRDTCVSRAAFEPGVSDIDVATLLHSYLKGFKTRRGDWVANEPVNSLTHENGVWTISTTTQTYRANTIINAAGAWADQIGALAGASHIGLVAKRRTAIEVAAPAEYEVGGVPLVHFVSNGAYIKPSVGRLMASPGDATPTVPQDVQPHEMDVAVLVDFIERETRLVIPRVLHSWAGLRSFVSDESPVVGFDSIAPGFCWCAAQGGYGIMMAPALARAVASLCLSGVLPEDFLSARISPNDLNAQRLDELN